MDLEVKTIRKHLRRSQKAQKIMFDICEVFDIEQARKAGFTIIKAELLLFAQLDRAMKRVKREKEDMKKVKK